MKIRVWHGEKHDDATVTEIELTTISGGIHGWVGSAQRLGGFFTGSHKNKNFVFVPFHRIHWIEQMQDEKLEANS